MTATLTATMSATTTGSSSVTPGATPHPETTRGCFAADSTATLSSGQPIALRDIREGDSVWAVSAAGVPVVSTIYYQHSRVDDGAAALLELATAAGKHVRLTGGHFLPVSTGGCSPTAAYTASTYMQASEVEVGAGLWVTSQPLDDVGSVEGFSATHPLVCDAVVSIRTVTSEGVRNPQTLEGTLIVDGVAGSIHLIWSFEQAYPAWLRASLPALHHLLMLAPRAGWRLNRAIIPPQWQHITLRLGTAFFECFKEAGEAAVAVVVKHAPLGVHPLAFAVGTGV